MSTPPTSKLDRILAEQKEYIATREKGYRERALKLYPWICGLCTREFTHKNLRELTVHHRATITTTTPPTAATGNYCVYIATITSTPNFTSMCCMVQPKPKKSLPQHTTRLRS